MPAPGRPDIQATQTPFQFPSDNSVCLWSARWTSTVLKQTQSVSSKASLSVWRRVKPHYCAARESSQSHQKSSLPPLSEPTASGSARYYMRGGTCDLFNYSALHFYPTIQNETRKLIASKIHLYNLPQAHKLPNFGAGVDEACRLKQIPFTAEPSHIVAVCQGGLEGVKGRGRNWMGLLFCSGGGGKKSTLVILWTLKHVR